MAAHQQRPIELRFGGAACELRVSSLEPSAFRVEVAGARLERLALATQEVQELLPVRRARHAAVEPASPWPAG